MGEVIAEDVTLVRGVSKDENEAAWFEQRRQGVTATEVRDLAGTYSGRERRRIMLEKLTGESSFSGNQYTDHGNAREPQLAAWVEENFGIEPNDAAYVRGRYIATPDGCDLSAFERVVSEIKTSKHDLTPGPLDELHVLVMAQVDSTWRTGHFWKTGYYDQMQWQMKVMDAERTLFVWEQHDGNWPDPAPLTMGWCWVLRDDDRIAELQAVADRFLDELDAARADGLAPVGGIPAEDAQDVHDLLQFRDAEAVAKAQKEQVWRRLQDRYVPGPAVSLENDEAKLTVSEAVVSERSVPVIDVAAAEEDAGVHAARAAVEKAEASVERARKAHEKAEAALAAALAPHTTITTETVTGAQRLTVTARKSTTK